MKITEEILKKMIEEELEDLTPEMELSPDVGRVKDAIGNRIDNKDEFTELLGLVLKMGNDITGAQEVLKQAMKQLPEFIAKLDGSVND